MVLQTTAWIGMAIHYTQQNGIVAGLEQTFDGAHPCSMCQAIKAAHKQEQKKTPLVQAEWKKDFPTCTHGFRVYQQWVELDYLEFAAPMESIVFRPVVSASASGLGVFFYPFERVFARSLFESSPRCPDSSPNSIIDLGQKRAASL